MATTVCPTTPVCTAKKRRLEKGELVEAVERSGYKVCDRMKILINCPDYVPSDQCEDVAFIALSPRELGFTQSSDLPTMAHLVEGELLARWSGENLGGQSLAPCELDDLCYFCENYPDQEEWDILHAAMEPIRHPDGTTVVLEVDHGFSGKCLRARPADTHRQYKLGAKMLYRIARESQFEEKSHANRYRSVPTPVRYP